MICKWCHAFLNIVDDTIDHNYRSMNLICSFSFVWCEIHTCTVTKESPIYTSQQKKRYKDIFEIYFLCENQNNCLLSFTSMCAQTNNKIPFHYGKIPESQFSVPWFSFRWSNYAFKSLAVINCAVIKSKQLAILKIWIFKRTSMPRLRQNDRERAVGMVQTGMTHQAVADHFNVSRVTIWRLMIRLRQTGRTNDRPVTAGHVWRHTVETDMYALFTFWAVWKRMRTLP
jgi:hypothetical protein